MKISKYVLLSTTVLGLVNPLVVLADDSNSSSTSSTSSSSKVESTSSSEQKDTKKTNSTIVKNSKDNKSETSLQDPSAEVGGIKYHYYEATGEAKAIKYVGEQTDEIIIPSSVNIDGKEYSVTQVGDYDGRVSNDIFNGYEDKYTITKVVLPDSIKIINGLSINSSITIPKSVKEINEVGLDGNHQVIDILNPETKFQNYGDGESFSDNSKHLGWNSQKTTFNLPEGMTTMPYLGSISFDDLTQISMPSTMTKIGDHAFQGMQMNSLVMPDQITDIGSYAFANNKLTEINLRKVKNIGTHAFQDNSSLSEINLGKNITEVGDWSFTSDNLKEVTLPDSVTRIGKYAFADNHITKINFPDSLIEIDDDAFVNRMVQYGSSNTFLSLDLPGSIKRIGKSAFGNTGVGSLTLHEGLKEIDERAFGEYQVQAGNPDKPVSENMSTTQGIKNLTIPASVETIGEDAFANNGISRIKFKGDNTKTGDKIASEQITGAHIYSRLDKDKERSYPINNLFDLYKQHVTKTNDDKSDILKWAGDNSYPTFDWTTDDGKVSGKWKGPESFDNSLILLNPEVIKEGQKYSKDDLFVLAKDPMGNDQKFDRNIVKIVKDDVNVNKPGTYNVTFRLDANVNYDNTDVVQLEPLEETTTVTVLPEEKGGVVVNYVDENGKDVASSETLTGKIGDTYKTEKKDIKGYVLSGVSGKEEGKYTDKPQAVTYIYKKIEGNTPTKPIANGNVTVRYVDESNKEIAKADIIKGKAGDAYETEKKNIDGYTFKEVQGNATGNITAFGQTVTYVYTKNSEKVANVTVKYVDQQGNSIQADKVVDATDKVAGDNYDTSTADYKLDKLTGTNGIKYILDTNKLPENAKGKFTDKEQTVTYVYNVNPSINTPTKPANPSTNTPTKPANPGTNTPTKPANPSTNTPTKPVNPGTNTPTKPVNPGTNTPTKPVNPTTNTPTKPVNPSTNTPTLPVNPNTNMPQLPANPGTNTPTLPANPGTNMPLLPANPSTKTPTLPANPSTNMPTLPVIDNNGDGSSDNGSNGNDTNNANNGDTSSNATTNDVVNNVVDGAQSLLPKTNAEKITFTGIVSVILASLAGLVVWKQRK